MSKPTLLDWRGLHIYPLPATLELDVQERHIKNGTPGSCTDCAISLAACEYLGIPCIGLLTTTPGAGVTLYQSLSPSPSEQFFALGIATWQPAGNYDDEEASAEWGKLTQFISTYDLDDNYPDPIHLTLPLSEEGISLEGIEL